MCEKYCVRCNKPLGRHEDYKQVCGKCEWEHWEKTGQLDWLKKYDWTTYYITYD